MEALAEVFFLIKLELAEINRNCRAAGTLVRPFLLGEYQPGDVRKVRAEVR